LSCHLFVLSLYILALWYDFSCHSSSSESCIFLLVHAASKSMFHRLIAQWALNSSSIDDRSSKRWVDMVTFQVVFYRPFYKPTMHQVVDLFMQSPSHWPSFAECS
jgi:hypothetical protein